MKKHIASQAKDLLLSTIHSMASDVSAFVKRPGHDFTRTRKMSFADTLSFILSLGADSLPAHIDPFFSYSTDAPSAAAIIQQRDKLSCDTFSYLFTQFTQQLPFSPSFLDYRLLAVDGSSHAMPHNPNDPDTFCQKKTDRKGYNCMHVNALYDLDHRVYVDAILQGRKRKNESLALQTMVDRSPISKALIIGDRGYECYNSLAHIQEKGFKFLIRVKDVNTKCGILSSIVLPKEDCFDHEVTRILTRSKAKKVREDPARYKRLSNSSPFDYLDKERRFYSLTFRIVRFLIPGGRYVTVLTNLTKEQADSPKLRELYQRRWGIETSFRELKYTIGTSVLHTKKAEHACHEIYAKLTMYNFCQWITSHVVLEQKKRTYIYQPSFKEAARLCITYFFGRGNITPQTLEALIKKHTVPIRKERASPRNIRPKSAVSFQYRVAR